jgi:predicted lipid carrier protein YhbT/chorismate mutase
VQPEVAAGRLSGVRRMIDVVDAGLLTLLATRRRLVLAVADLKRAAGREGRDPGREQQVHSRARRLALQLGLPAASSERFVSLLIEEACLQQQLDPAGTESTRPAADLDQGRAGPVKPMIGAIMPPANAPTDPNRRAQSWLRLVPPPARLAPALRLLPDAIQARLLEAILRRALSIPVAAGALEPLLGRRVGIEVTDLGLRWIVTVDHAGLHVCGTDGSAEATVRGSTTDLLLLASRRDDADTLFFQRRLVLTGDTELGLTARNLLDQLPWEDVPLGLRIALHRCAGLAVAARRAYRGDALQH